MATLAIFGPRRSVRWKYLLRHSGSLRTVTCAASTSRKRNIELPCLVMCPSRRRLRLLDRAEASYQAHTCWVVYLFGLGVTIDAVCCVPAACRTTFTRWSRFFFPVGGFSCDAQGLRGLSVWHRFR